MPSLCELQRMMERKKHPKKIGGSVALFISTKMMEGLRPKPDAEVEAVSDD